MFILLALGDLTGNHIITKIAGFKGLVCGFSAFYAATAQIINSTYKKDILPL